MKLSNHDQKILDDMEKQLEKLTGKKSTHVFLDTRDTIEPNNYQDANRESQQEWLGK